MKKINHTLRASLILSFSTLAACSGSEKEDQIFSRKAVGVKVATAQTGSSLGSVEVSGQVEAVHSALISTRMMGYIQKVYADIGDHVQQGQVLFRVNAADIRAKSGQANASIAQAEAALANAKKDYDRFTALYGQNSATAKELDNATLQYKAAKAQLEAAREMHNEAEANMSYATVTAPFSGVITQKMADAGSMATPGIPVLALEEPGALQVTAAVNDVSATGIHANDSVLIELKSIGRFVKGKVSRISQSAGTSAGQYILKVALPGEQDEKILSGMYATVHLYPKQSLPAGEQIVSIPQSALFRQQELTGIFTLNDRHEAVLRWVRTGKVTGTQIEILSGLAPGEKYISESKGRLYNGVRVTAL